MLLPFEKIKREPLVKVDAQSNPEYGKDPYSRTIPELLERGCVAIDKFKGPTSHQVSDFTKRILGVQKAGHSGTLDPAVTGVLPICTEKGTRVLETLLEAGKEYVCLMHIHEDIHEAVIRDVIMSFVGKIKQLPPIKSAVKRQWRYRKIYYIDINEIQGRDVLFTVGCQAGTYIRKLVHDMGQKLGCGAHMAQLRRTKAGPFKEENLVTLQDLADAMWYYKNEQNETFLRTLVRPVEEAVSHLPKVWVNDFAVDTVCHGADLKVPGVVKIESEIQIDEFVAVMTLKNELVALGLCKMLPKDVIENDKGLVIKVTKVFMDPGTYPKYVREDKKSE